MSTLIQPPVLPAIKRSFYRAELDVLRLLAFVCVFLTHGPRWVDPGTGWRHMLAISYNSVATGGVYGLSLFFFLSSYLITELLLREQQATGTIHLRWFYIRRVLRIWPLYYLGVACALLVPFLTTQVAPFNRHQIAYFVFFVGYFAEGANGNPFGVLWSISVEELFYAIWPFLAMQGRSRLLWICLLIIPGSLLLALTAFDLWYNPFVQFLFFASGAIVALVFRDQDWNVSNRIRFVMGFSALATWTVARLLLHMITPRVIATPIAFVLADLGCVLVFLAFLNASLPQTGVTRALLYLGKVSYGLYVFHLASYMFVEHWSMPWGIYTSVSRAVLTQILSFTLTVGIASLSYRYFEGPFLRLKEKYAPIKTRI